MIVNMGVLIFLTEGLGILYALSSLFAIEASIISNFLLNNAWTWSDRRSESLARRVMKYHAVAGVTAMATNWGLLIVLTKFAHLDYRVANLIGIAVGVIINFVLNHVWTFGERTPGSPDAIATADDRRLAGRVLAALAILTIAKVWFASRAELLPEEAYYWTYSQFPALSYFDHPPMVAWVIACGTAIFGDTEFSVRIGTIALSLGSSVWIFMLTRLWFGRACAWWAVLLFNLLPIFIGTGVLAFPDGPLVFFWLMTMYAISKVVGRDSPQLPVPTHDMRAARLAALPYWLLAGVGLGGALLSKYTAVMLTVSVGTFLLLSPSQRFWLRRPEPWMSLLIAFALFAPVIVWNAQNDWASFLFQSTRTAGPGKDTLKHALEFWLIQIGILGPIVFVLFAMAVARSARLGWWQRRNSWNFALSFFLPLFTVFLLASFKTNIHVNWTAPAFLSLIVVGAAMFHEARQIQQHARRCRFALRGAIVFAMAILALGAGVIIYGVPFAASRIGGWRHLAVLVNAAQAEVARDTGRNPFVLGADKYNLAAELSFYTGKPKDQVNTLALGKHGLGFRYWTDLRTLDGSDAIVVLPKLSKPALRDLTNHFTRVGSAKPFSIPTVGNKYQTVWLVVCRGYCEKGPRISGIQSRVDRE